MMLQFNSKKGLNIIIGKNAAEAIQTILHRKAHLNPYEALKRLTRTNEAIDKKAIHIFIATLEVSDEIKAELMKITPSNFLRIKQKIF